MLNKWICINTNYITTVSLFVIFVIGFFVPHVFAETDIDYDVIQFTDPKGKYSIEFPSDGWSIHTYSGTSPKAMIKDHLGETVLMLFHFNNNSKDPHGDPNDQKILQFIYKSNIDQCASGYSYHGFTWYGCYQFKAVDKKTAYTNQGEKLWMVDMTFITVDDKYYFIEAEIFDGYNDSWTITARTTVRDSEKTYKFDTENLEKIREVIKSFTILKPDTAPELESEQVETPQTKIQKVPDWVRNIFIWYSEEQISEDELLNAIKFLVNQGIINLDS